MNLAQQIRSLKPGKTFIVKTEKERQSVLRTAKFLKDNNFIDFAVVTKADAGGFKIGAI